jgi:hypothetical protein
LTWLWSLRFLFCRLFYSVLEKVLTQLKL